MKTVHTKVNSLDNRPFLTSVYIKHISYQFIKIYENN